MIEDAAAASDPAARRAKILRRTRVGGGIAVAVAALLWMASRSESGAIVLAVGALLSALACFEFQRMGGLAGARWGWVLGACWFVTTALAWHAMINVHRARTPIGVIDWMQDGYVPVLWLELIVVSLLGVLVRTVAAGWGRRGSQVGSIGLALWTVMVCVVFLAPPNPLQEQPQVHYAELGVRGFALALLMASPMAWFAHLYWRHENRARLVLALWIGPLLTLPLVWLWHVWNDWGTSGLVSLIVLAKVGDIAGYYVGSAIGVLRPFPRISPGKTLAGCWGSFVAGTLAGGALVLAEVLPSGPWGVVGGLAAGAAVNLAAQAGDLLESWIKRGAGVKDSGTWFGPSGGVLDLVDSLLLAVPAALLVWPVVLRS
ncbi:MAG TPA: phosphatidate cytidylyltransferase [Planctomycetota bacterium]|nr:phosphatidate cytidylyltransferase [Planctomycetota bacterium]